MLQLVKLALSKPYTFVVLAILILISGITAWLRTPTDIFPDIKIPVIAAVWTYNGLPPEDMSGRVVRYYEQQLSSTVNDIEHIESQSMNGVAVVKIFFQPNVDIRTASAQVTAASQTVLKQLPPGITPPQILQYSASTVPILQLALSSKTLSEQSIFDAGQNFIRPALAAVPGSAIPTPYGGRVRQIQIDLDPAALQARHLSATDVGLALAAQNQIVPAGTTKIGQYEYYFRLNNSPAVIDRLNDLPIKTVDGVTVFMRDVAHVRDGSPPQQNVVHVDGARSVLMTILKAGSSSTIAIVDGVKATLPKLKETLPSDLNIQALSDQSLFVKAAVSGVVREGAIAATLTSLMILLFLGSWRSTVIIAASIPLAILAAVAALAVAGETLNVMTLGGLALAVGILVDDATVTIENINWHLEQGKTVRQSILDGAEQIVRPALVSLLCICIAFVPMFFLPGVAGFLFAPMAEAVVFAMIASFILSRTLVPTMGNYLLREHATEHTAEIMATHDAMAGRPKSRNPLRRFQQGFEHGFERVATYYQQILAFALARRAGFVPAFLAVVLISFALIPLLGRNFFPTVDAGQISLHVRAPVGTRLEESSALFGRIEDRIRSAIPRDQIVSIVDNIGQPVSGINNAYSNTGTIGPQDGDILVTLSEHHRPTADYVRDLRRILPESFPGSSFAFLPADIISQILNFGAPAPIDVKISGPDVKAGDAYAHEIAAKMAQIAGLADVRVQQANDYPALAFDVDRSQADRLGITENDVTRAISTNLAGSLQIAPTFWLNPKNGVSYPIVVQTPQYRTDSLAKMDNLPVTGAGQSAQILGALGTLRREPAPAVVSHYAVQSSYDIYATTQGRDLGAVAGDIQKLLDATVKDQPKGSTVRLMGQVQTMNTAFTGLIVGLAGAILLIYLLIVVNFQSWVDPAVIVSALPAALAGIVWMLFATHTPLSVPALTGAIMCMGVATANSVLVISFARERLAATGDALAAATEAGAARFRPVLMTALAMIIGMAPMALGMGEGGEQNAPLGRAVIGGLICATIATLVFVPVVFSIAHRRERPHPAAENEPHATGEFVHAE
ncbi:efflux RND transporter permease subunit [Sphingomonas nostoxanthinifaciens]|uniref:efflux RND transporter permease subunit n=1 Tax=Sphingomonas nostoxanthinifaciens TaxID=2872652 RepID=UPI001CC1F6DC|nr:efflux RND transporter permease subunit [Sphingomonas nostoxanthinifaciens]UAK25954.1 efflux RND transporter permease subunit [Sphingomonas nostoxanthinifaciens]